MYTCKLLPLSYVWSTSLECWHACINTFQHVRVKFVYFSDFVQLFYVWILSSVNLTTVVISSQLIYICTARRNEHWLFSVSVICQTDYQSLICVKSANISLLLWLFLCAMAFSRFNYLSLCAIRASFVVLFTSIF